MQADQPHTLFHQVPDRFQAVVAQERMAAAAVAIDDDCRRAGKGSFRLLRPAVGVNLGNDAGDVIQARFEQETAGAVLMVTEAMKMETNVKAKVDGVVAELRHEQGAQIEQGDLLVVLE